MEGARDDVDDERVRRYIAMARDRLAWAVQGCASPPVVDQARRYLSDAEYHFGKGDKATALASASYSHGLLDGCIGQGEARAKQPSFLARIFVNQLWRTPSTTQLASLIGVDEESLRITLGALQLEGLVRLKGNEVRLTPIGRSKIMVGLVAGVFDLVHPGHLALLRWARSQVDVLAVIIARDPSSKMRKGRAPIQNEMDRLAVVSALAPVDYARLGDHDDIYSPVLRIRPDLIVLGKDQDVDPRRIGSDLARRGLRVKVVRSRAWDSGDLSKTSRIIERIRKRSSRDRGKER